MSTHAKFVADLKREIGVELRKQRGSARDEAKLHGVIALALKNLGVPFEQERKLGQNDRLDFLVEGGVCLEVKKTAAGEAALRQIGRYLEHPEVSAAVGIAMRWDGVPPKFRGKPVFTIELWRLVL